MGRRRDRLRTRVYCESGALRRRFRVGAQDHDKSALGESAPGIVSAMNDAEALVIQSDGKSIFADLDGNVRDIQRIMAAASAVVTLAREGDDAGPYR